MDDEVKVTTIVNMTMDRSNDKNVYGASCRNIRCRFLPIFAVLVSLVALSSSSLHVQCFIFQHRQHTQAPCGSSCPSSIVRVQSAAPTKIPKETEVVKNIMMSTWPSACWRLQASEAGTETKSDKSTPDGGILPIRSNTDKQLDLSSLHSYSVDRRKMLMGLLAVATSTDPMTRLVAARANAATDMEMTTTTSTLAASSFSSSSTVPGYDLEGIKFPVVDIMKPPADDREYLVDMLENGLRVVYCSDPSSNEAGAAMDVHVGACSDPKDIPGLAHFNEHMLFLGTKQYPNEDSFEKFLSANGGSSNAYTASENTVYHFTLQQTDDGSGGRSGTFGEGLKRFGSFFTSPLFTESATGRELNAIESENAKNLQSDSFRMYQINKERQNPKHPHSKFFTGNKKTLLDDTKAKGINLRQSLIDFYTRYYSADQMTLAVVGPQPISKLQDLTKEAFSDIPNRSVGPPENAWKGIIPPYTDNDTTGAVKESLTTAPPVIPSFGNVVKVVPVQDLRQITVTWPIIYKDDKDRQLAQLTKQAQYVAHLIGHEGPGSLLSYLKRKGWANSLSAQGESDLSDFETFECTVGLTKPGLENVDAIVESLFSYIAMIRDKSIPKYVFNEVLQLEELPWRFSSKGGLSSFVQSLATALQLYPPSLCVAGPQRLALCKDSETLETTNAARTGFTSTGQLDFTRALANDFVENLTVDNAMLTILSQSFRGKTDKKEMWYGTNYSVERIPISTLELWKRPVSASMLGLEFPKPNVFIPSEDGLRVKFSSSKKSLTSRSFEDRVAAIPPPRIIRDDGPEGRWTVYYKPDNTFGQPKAFVIFQLLTKQVYSSAKAAALSSLFEFCVGDKLTEYAYDAGLAGLTYNVQVVPRGVRMTFGGYNDKLQKFATYISKKVSSDVADILPSNEYDFERYKDILSRTYAAFDVKQPYAHCSYYSQLMTQPKSFQYSNEELRAATDTVSLDDLTAYVSSVWKEGKGLALVQGNLEEKEASQLVQTIDKTLGFKPIQREEIPPELSPLPLPQGTKPTRLTITEPNPENSNAASYVAIQSLSEDPKEHVMMELIGSILSEPFYEDLRTKQQLGYIVSSGVRPVGKTKQMGFIVQSSTANNQKLTSSIFKYLDGVRNNKLTTLPNADFAVFVKSLIDIKTQPDKVLATEVTRNWAEIASGRLQFDRTQKEVAALLDLTKDDLLAFWDQLYESKSRRVLVTEMVPQVGVASSQLPPKSTGNAACASLSSCVLGIGDIDNFRDYREHLLETHAA